MRLSEEEIGKHKRQLAEWSPPTDMRERLKRLMDRLGGEDLFTQSGVDFVCEAWVAVELGEKRGAISVRLIAEERPDLALRFSNGEVEIYELVEVDRLERKRGDEYAALAEAGRPTYQWPVEEWATVEQAFNSIRSRAEKKAKRAEILSAKGTPYPKQTRLLFYVNLGDFGAYTEDIERIIPTAVEPARKSFSSVWVLWKNRVYRA
jgi:hypothetical protein